MSVIINNNSNNNNNDNNDNNNINNSLFSLLVGYQFRKAKKNKKITSFLHS